MNRGQLIAAATFIAAAAVVSSGLAVAVTKKGPVSPSAVSKPSPQNAAPTATPIKHLVVIFNENVAFDHYFATYPSATNPPNEPIFTAKPGTPTVNNLVTANLLTNNPNVNPTNGAGATNPFRIDRSDAATADQGHGYVAEQRAYDGGLNDLFPAFTGNATTGRAGPAGTKGQVMGYFDGNTVTGLWNYAQRFAMSDNLFADTYGPSTPGALNVVSGQTNGLQLVVSNTSGYYVNDTQGGFTMIGDVDPGHDTCSSASNQGLMTSQNIGDLLNGAGISWGGFMGGFDLSVVNPNNSTGCARSTVSPQTGVTIRDYVAHHAWFQYYATTNNPTHARPSSIAAIGSSFEQDGITPEPANHNYDVLDFFSAVQAGNFPAVSFIKMPADDDGHAGYSNPLDEQKATVALINFLQQQPDWNSTAVIIAWDDSDGWYDHAFATTTSSSFDAADQLNSPGVCGSGQQHSGVGGLPVNGRCGPGPRLPFLVISPWAKSNYVGHGQISLASVPRFIEDNWLAGQRLGGGSFDASTGSIDDLFDFTSGGHNAQLYLDPANGTQLAMPGHDFSGDRLSDILLHHTNGSLSTWQMAANGTHTPFSFGVVPTAWQIAGTTSLVASTGDVDGDGKADILWRHTNGSVSLWEMKGGASHTPVSLGVVATAWQIAGVGDFDGDGHADILWRHTNGSVSIWKMAANGSHTALNFGVVDNAWQVAGIGDVNGDGNADIIWRHTNGTALIWKMNGGTSHTVLNLGVVATAWQIVGVGDVDGDGNADLFWRHSNGSVSIWKMAANGTHTVLNLGTVATAWQIVSIGDYNGDGRADILWRHTNGSASIWTMNANGTHTAVNLGTVATAWTFVE